MPVASGCCLLTGSLSTIGAVVSSHSYMAYTPCTVIGVRVRRLSVLLLFSAWPVPSFFRSGFQWPGGIRISLCTVWAFASAETSGNVVSAARIGVVEEPPSSQVVPPSEDFRNQNDSAVLALGAT